ncbi:hypothetical protein [Novosphingobium mangrovi (ex Huang et al. 2023)]|uniref:SnoaL-like domain-containing protein n=1 Tax=Novosphingobium mangrovi (ex Huang et al. 2023) TaxID=2976432 RepID=A0ABT2I535_9SPHN|nr:hypothetical protein [Novosphingobium mangrovi (ex Huang et al. 2023)]MCT2399929.1 hypothetical protein [Novosphingobium mangrovi (ex Huang et al. 2023)]
MEIITATATTNEKGPLTKLVEAYSEAVGQLAAQGISSPSDWEPLSEYIATDEFKRVGAYLEELDWDQYCRFMTDWVGGGTRFEMDMFRITEAGRVVVQEIEERHYRGDEFIRKNVIALYVFNEQKKIVHLDIYEQARDSGRWIQEAASAAMA